MVSAGQDPASQERRCNRLSPYEAAITGCGWITPAGAGTVGDGLTLLRANPVRATEENFAKAAAITEELPEPLLGDRLASICGWCVLLALRDAGLSLNGMDRDRVGVTLGSAWAGVLGMIDFANDVRSQSSRFVSPLRFPQTVGNFAAGSLARAFELRGPNATTSCGEQSGLAALHEALRLMEQNRADVMISGGADVLRAELIRGLDDSDVPFSEGACFLVLEKPEIAKARGARIRGWLSRSGAQSPQGPTDGWVLASDSASHHVVDSNVAAWTGHCFAALGPATVATVLGAWEAHPEPPPRPATQTAGIGSFPLVSARCLYSGTVESAWRGDFPTVIRPGRHQGNERS